jgi:predicted ester cyclase
MMQQETALMAKRNTRSAMDRAIDEHFRHERGDDVDGVLATLSNDVDHDVVGSPTGPLRGKDQARAFYERLFADLDQHSVASLRRYYGHDFVVDESLWRGTAVGNPLGFEGRNRPLEFRILHIFEFAENGAIRRENVWMDTAAIATQLKADIPPPTSATSATSAESRTTATVMAFYQAFDRGVLGGFEAVGSEFEARVFGDTVLDWAGFVGFGEAFLDAFPNGRHTFDCVITEGDSVATIGRYRGHHEREFMGVPATGKEVDFAVFHVDRVRDGRIVEHRGIGDANTMWAQLGVSPPSSRP